MVVIFVTQSFKMFGSCLQSSLKSPVIAHRHLGLEMFEGKRLKSIVKIWV